MKLMRNRILSLTLIFILLFAVSAHGFELSSKGAISMNFDTGEVYYEKNADVLMTPASLTKIMTLYIVFEKMASGEFSEDTLVPVSRSAAKASRSKIATNIPLTEGQSLPMSTLIDAIVIVSACACSTVVAEYISGSEWEFSRLMNETAKGMGINAYFEDASGLSDNNRISPRGVALLVREFVIKYPEILEYTSKVSEKINGKEYYSTNYLLPIQKTDYYYPGVDGFKTGTTTKAGKCIAVTAEKDLSRVITVVMNASTNKNRYTDSITLLNNAFYKASYITGNMFSTDIRAFVNGFEIPCCYKKFGTNEVCITAEELRFYGFDTHYDEETSTLYIAENTQKEISPIDCEKTGKEIAHKVYKNPNLKVILVNDSGSYSLETVVSLGGQCAISIDELGKYYTKTWDNATRRVDLFTQ